MTAVDRAFIKAYTSRRSVRGASADRLRSKRSATLGEYARTRHASYRVDGPHVSRRARAGPHAKSTSRKPRRPSAENGERTWLNASSGDCPQRRRRRSTAPSVGSESVVSLADSAVTPDWIWQREPHPVFADAASTAGPAIDSPLRPKLPPAKSAVGRIRCRKATQPRQISRHPKCFRPRFCRSPCHRSATPGMRLAAAGDGSAAKRCRRRRSPRRCRVRCRRSRWRRGSKTGLQPALEVDQFLWPAEIEELSDAAAAALEAFADAA